MVREVSESCVDSLLTEMVACYCNRFYANKPDLAARRIEAIGFQVGHQLSERYTMERPRFSDHLEAIKFICKDFWSELFKKQIDNLKTNHRGTFVLQDNKFRWLARMSFDSSADNGNSVQDNSSPTAENLAAQAMSMHLYFPCGIIRGALSNLGITCAVSADISNLPACVYLSNSLSLNKQKHTLTQAVSCDQNLGSPVYFGLLYDNHVAKFSNYLRSMDASIMDKSIKRSRWFICDPGFAMVLHWFWLDCCCEERGRDEPSASQKS
ncbi:hypothetical protein RIF29_24353 [Crotalaria pallida]|uniref:Uncharacterized protein n=1 Tax=Crotalaria pallida TaxID=3830 RepID=A0AAN9ERU0_CROPI